jgi:signal transduction histidine kinase
VRPGSSIALRLFAAVGLPAAIVVVVMGAIAWRIAERAVTAATEREVLGQARASAMTINPTGARLIVAGEEGSRTYKRLVARLAAIQQATGSVRAMIVDDQLMVRADGNGALAIGAPAPRAALDALEIHSALGDKPRASVPFSSTDGKRFLAAYARIPEPTYEDGAAASPGPPLVLALEAPAAALDAARGGMRRVILLIAITVMVLLALVLTVARTITRPLERLADDAERLGKGALSAPLAEPRGTDEVARLGHTLESMRAALVDRDRERQMMLAGIAHEIRNPLGGMELFSGLLEEGIAELPEGPERAELKNQAGRVRSELRYLTNVVNGFLSFARETAPSVEPTDVRALCEDVRALVATHGRAPVTLDVPEGLVATIDAARIKQALLNLAENALAATAQDGRVVLRAKADGAWLMLSVEDTGAGMSKETLDKAFTPFFTTKEKGSGLGLALVRKLSRDHGGDAEIASEPGRGTTVTMRLPLSAPQAL